MTEKKKESIIKNLNPTIISLHTILIIVIDITISNFSLSLSFD